MIQPKYIRTHRISRNSNIWEEDYKRTLFGYYNNETIEVVSTNACQVEEFLLVTVVYIQKSEYVLPGGGWHDGDRNFD